MVNLAGFGLSAAINGGIALVVFSIFCAARRSPSNRFVYAPRTLHPEMRQGRPSPPPLSSSYFGWIVEVLRIPHSTFISSAGLDAYMFLRWMQCCVVLFAGMTVLGVGVLVPVNYTANGGADGFDAISMSNLPQNSVRLVAHLLVSYLFAVWTYYVLYRLWLEYADLRTQYMAREQLSNRGLTLLLHNIPSDARKSDAALLSTFAPFFPAPASSAPSSSLSSSSTSLLSPSAGAGTGLLTDGEGEGPSTRRPALYSAYVAKDLGKMPDKVGKRDDALNSLEHAVLAYQVKPEERPQAATRCFCCAKRDALEYHEEVITEQEGLLAEGKKAALSEGSAWPNGFVTFDSATAYAAACAVRPSAQRMKWTHRPAPELRDVYWPSMSYTPLKRLYMGVIVTVLLWALVLLWTIPITIIQGIANVQSLADSSGAIGVAFGWINDIPAGVLAIIDGFLPGLVLTVFNILLPLILYKLSQLEGIGAWSALQGSVVCKLSIFQIVNNFFLSIASTAILGNLESFIQVSGIVKALATNIPLTGTFFVTYLLFTTLSVYPMALLNPGGLIVGRLKKKLLMKTARDVVAVESAPPRDYGVAYPITLFTFIIAISYSVLASIALPFAVVYFSVGYFVAKYNHLYVYNTHFETGGQLWPVVFRAVTWCVFISQLTFTVLLGLKEATAAAVVSAPLIVAPWLFYFFVQREFLQRTRVLSAEAAALVEAERDKRRMTAAPVKGQQQQRGLSTAFLDDLSTLQDGGYLVSDIRCRRSEDLLFPHNSVTQPKTEAYRREGPTTSATREGEAEHFGAEAGAPSEEGKLQSGERAPSEAVSRSQSEAHVVSINSAAASQRSSTSGLATGAEGGGGGGGVSLVALRTSLFSLPPLRSSPSAVLQSTLRASDSLGPLPLPMTYVQPELVTPPHLPIPHSMPPPVQSTDSIEQQPALLEELSWAALERHSRGGGGGGKKGGGGGQGGERPPRRPQGAEAVDGAASSQPHNTYANPLTAASGVSSGVPTAGAVAHEQGPPSTEVVVHY